MHKNLTDQQERDRALLPNQSFIVQAPAGSGKTEILTQRFLRLLSCVKFPEEILAITFTRKAASQMRTRILSALEKAGTGRDPSLHKKEKTLQLACEALQQDHQQQWQLLKNPNRLRIQTIDSFCASLTKQTPILSHLGAPLTISDYPELLYQQAATELFSKIDEDDLCALHLKKLLLHLDNNLPQVSRLLINMLAKRDQWLHPVIRAKNQKQLQKTLEIGLTAITEEALEQGRQTFPKDLTQDLKLLTEFAKEHQTEQEIIIFNYSQLPSDLLEQKKHWISLANFLLTDKNEWRKTVTQKNGFPAAASAKNSDEKKYFKNIKEQMLNLLNKLTEYENFKEALIEIKNAPPTHYTHKQWEILTALLQLLPIVVAQLKLVFSEKHQTDYAEISLAALDALGEPQKPTDLALILDYRIHHILVDEFQDTSISQFHLLEKLTTEWQFGDGRTLFVVGDPMQSIYRFRDAEVGLFLRAQKEGIGFIKLEPLTLSTNFRSSPALVHWFNENFIKIFPSVENIQAGAVSYTCASTIFEENKNAFVKIHPLINSDENEEAHQMVKLIQQIQHDNPDKTIAVLAKARHHLNEILKTLREHQIAYQAVEIDHLSSRPIIQDLLALTKALLHPADRVAWLSILRAPWCGLTLADLLKIARANEISIWDALQQEKIICSLTQEGQRRVKIIRAILSEQFHQRYRKKLRAWVYDTWSALNGPDCIHSSELSDTETYFNLLDKLEIGGDIKNFQLLQEKIEQLFADSKTDDPKSIKVMTIHKAKGLEFDIVIVPAIERSSPKPDPQLLLWAERPRVHLGDDLILAPIKSFESNRDEIYQYLYHEDYLKNQFENIRLFYVASTRAKKQLHFFGQAIYDTETQQLKNPMTDSFLKLLWPMVKDIFEQASTHLETKLVPLEQNKKTKNKIYRIKNPKISETNFTFASNENNVIHSDFFAQNENHARQMGILIHEILKQISLESLSSWTKTRIQNSQKFWRLRLMQLGMNPEHTGTGRDLSLQKYIPVDIALSQVVQTIQNILSDPRGQWILSPHAQAQSEFSLSFSQHHQLKRVILDRTFLDEQNKRWIIDYKTETPNQKDLNSWLQQEKLKHQAQLVNYANILKKIYNEKICFGLYFSSLPTWIEWQFTNEALSCPIEH